MSITKPTPRTNKKAKQCKESDFEDRSENEIKNCTAAAKQRERVVRISKTEEANKSTICSATARPSGREKLKEKEYGGYESQNLLEPTRFGDWEVKGRCSDF